MRELGSESEVESHSRVNSQRVSYAVPRPDNFTVPPSSNGMHKRKRRSWSQDTSTALSPTVQPVSAPTSLSLADARVLLPQQLLWDSDVIRTPSSASPLLPNAGEGQSRCSGSGSHFIALAQIVASQLSTQATFGGELDLIDPRVGHEGSAKAEYQVEDPLTGAIKMLFPQSWRCNLQNSMCLGDSYRLASTAKIASRSSSHAQDPDKPFENASELMSFSIPTPNVRVRRGENLLDIATTALRFWEELGLSPCSGSKNVNAFCIYPHSEMILRGVNSFLDMMSNSFQALKLGTHVSGHAALDSFSDGIVPFSLQSSQWQDVVRSINTACERLGMSVNRETSLQSCCSCSLGSVLSHLSASKQTIIVYLINPLSNFAYLPYLCESFMMLSDRLDGSQESNVTFIVDQKMELVFRILPMPWVASINSIPIPSFKAFAQLSKEIYDKSPAHATEFTVSPFLSSCFVELAATLPKSVTLKLTPNFDRPFTNSDGDFHLAYSWGQDKQWLSTSITDTLGRKRWNSSYCLGPGLKNPWPILRDVCQQILDTVLDMMPNSCESYRVFVIKDKAMAEEEINGT